MQASRHQTGTIQAARSQFAPLRSHTIVSSHGRPSCSSSRHLHGRVTRRGQLQASASDDILKKYGISPVPGDGSNKPAPIKQQQTAGELPNPRVHAYPCNNHAATAPTRSTSQPACNSSQLLYQPNPLHGQCASSLHCVPPRQAGNIPDSSSWQQQHCTSHTTCCPVCHPPAPLSKAAGNGVFLLLLVNVVLFVLDHVLHIKGIQGLYLNHAKPQWYQVSRAAAAGQTHTPNCLACKCCVRAFTMPSLTQQGTSGEVGQPGHRINGILRQPDTAVWLTTR